MKIIMEELSDEAVCQLNMEYKKILRSREYLLGRKIYKFLYFLKKGKIRSIFLYLRSLSKEKKIKSLDKENISYFTCRENEDISARIAVYTCLTGNYDILREPLYRPENIDYVVFTDMDIPKDSLWKKIDLNSIKEIAGLDHARKNRYIKLHPHEFFNDYMYSVYLDANIRIIGDLSKYIRCVGDKIPIAVNWHPSRNSIYTEAEVCCLKQRDDPYVIQKQIEGYRSEGMPDEFGLIEGGMIVRKHNQERCIRLMDLWWNEIKKKSARDQLSFPYAVWKMGCSMTDLGFISKNIRNIDAILLIPHGGLEIG